MQKDGYGTRAENRSFWSADAGAYRLDDSGRILEAFRNLETQSIYTSFFSYKKGLTDTELKQFTDVDFHQVVALVVTTGPRDCETLIAGGRYIFRRGAGAGSQGRSGLHD